jgi:glycosyltransferase involved in cell wall biosynthesis
MEHCVKNLTSLTTKASIEIILVDDGSTDETPTLCDEFASSGDSPNICIYALHQANAGHGGAINTALGNAHGLYFKVIDSDDWLDTASLEKVLERLMELTAEGSDKAPDLFIANYVYEHIEDKKQKPINYRNIFPSDRLITWKETRPFLPDQYLLMHSVIYRTSLLHDMDFNLPVHTFYVDNIFVYLPLPHVTSIYYMDTDLYHYTIGREGQSVNQEVMLRRIDQQLLVTRIMLDNVDLDKLKTENPRLSAYMRAYIAMMTTICSVFLFILGDPSSLAKEKELWASIKRRHKKLYTYLKFRIPSNMAFFPGHFGRIGRKFCIAIYKFSRKVYKFN